MARYRAHLELHTAVLVLSLTGILGKLIQMGVAATICARSVLAAIVLGLILRVRRQPLQLAQRVDQYGNVLAGVLLAGHWITFFLAMRTGPVAIGMLGLFTFPVMLTFLEPLVFREKLRPWTVVHALVVLGGLLLVVPRFNLSDSGTIALLWGLLSAVLYAARNLASRRYVHAHGSMVVMFWQVLVAAVVLSPSLAFAGDAALPMDVLWLLILGIVCTAGAHTMFVASFRHFPVATASIILTLEPVYAALLAIPIFDEWPRWQTWVGGAIMLAAIAHEMYHHDADNPPSSPQAAAAGAGE